jgi:hypothetical protein
MTEIADFDGSDHDEQRRRAMGFQLGLCSANTESGLAITTASGRWSATGELAAPGVRDSGR